MDLGADMMRDQANDALGIGRRDPVAGILEAAGEAVDPEPAVGIEHDLDDARIFQMSRRSAGPSAVRSMRVPRAMASDRKKEIVVTSRS